ncbi:MAG: vWA domain-containing protein [Planctomycetota bacterium]
MRMLICSTTLSLILAATAPITAGESPTSGPSPSAAAKVDAAPLIQIALLLDTSNSMDGLINQARSQLWAIVNSLGHATRGGRAPVLQVALYEYGQTRIAAEEQHLRQVLPFSTDLDLVSQKLFALTTNGGDEYCGSVIRAATRGLVWSSNPADLKVMIIAGNEPFTQGTADYRASCVEAVASRGIVINTIYCGNSQEGAGSGWSDGAKLGNGAYAAIDHSRAVVVPPTPQDEELARLGREINGTYVPYGRAGAVGAENQVAQDTNSMQLSASSFASRVCAKASANYCNSHWDLVDAVERKAVALATIALDDLPEGMRNLTPDQRAAYLAGKLAERTTIQKRIGQLTVERERFLAAQVKPDGAQTLDDVIIAAIRAQAIKRGFTVQ